MIDSETKKGYIKYVAENKSKIKELIKEKNRLYERGLDKAFVHARAINWDIRVLRKQNRQLRYNITGVWK